mgnify:CR=1 FL=1
MDGSHYGFPALALTAPDEPSFRFRPGLETGTYEVSFAAETPFDPQRRAMDGQTPVPVNREFNPDPRFEVWIKHRNVDERIWVEPAGSAVIGVFEFSEGMDGIVDILSIGSTGQVLVDAFMGRYYKQQQVYIPDKSKVVCTPKKSTADGLFCDEGKHKTG